MKNITSLVAIIFLLTSCGGGDTKSSGADADADGFSDAVDVDSDNNGLIEIDTLTKLNNMRHNLAGTARDDGAGNANSDGCPSSGCHGYELTADLNFDTNGDDSMDEQDDFFAGGKGWLPVGNMITPFTAHFDGNGHHIRNLFINRPSSDMDTDGGSNIGLFGVIDGTAANMTLNIRNLVLDGPLTNITGHVPTGTLAGLVHGNTAISNVHVRGKVTGSGFSGGLVGSFNYVSVPATACDSCMIEKSSFIGGIADSWYGAGGLAGITFHADIRESFATGNILAKGNAGGLVGDANEGTTINNCFSASNTGAQFAAGALVGKSSNATYADNYFANNADEFLVNAAGDNVSAANVLNPTGTQGLPLAQLKRATGFTNWDTDWDFGTSDQLPARVDRTTGTVHRGTATQGLPGTDCTRVVILNMGPSTLFSDTCAKGSATAQADCVEMRLRAAIPDACLATHAFDIYVPGTAQEDGAWKNFNAMFARDTGRTHISVQYTNKVSFVDKGAYSGSMKNGRDALLDLLAALKSRFNTADAPADIRAFGHSKGSHSVALASEDPAHQDVQFYAFAQAAATEARIRGDLGYLHKKRDNLVTLTWKNDEVQFYDGGLMPEVWGFPGLINQQDTGATSPFAAFRIDHHSNYGGLFTDGVADNNLLQGEGNPSAALPYCATGNKWGFAKNQAECTERKETFQPYFWGNADCRNRAFAMMKYGETANRYNIGYSGPRAAACQDDVGTLNASYTLQYKLQPGDQDDCRMHLDIWLNGISNRANGGKISLSSVTNTGWRTATGTVAAPLHQQVFVKAHLTKEGSRACGGIFAAQSEAFMRRLTLTFTHPDTGETITRTIIGHHEGKEYVYPLKVTGKNNVGWIKYDRPNYTHDTWDLYFAQESLMFEGSTTSEKREGNAYKWVWLLD